MYTTEEQKAWLRGYVSGIRDGQKHTLDESLPTIKALAGDDYWPTLEEEFFQS